MRTEIKWAELHSALFIAGANLGLKLDTNSLRFKGLKLEYDEDKKQLYVTYNGKTARVPEPSILSMVEGSADEDKVVTMPKGPIKAQVSSPQDHVFSGHGAGKTK